MTNHETGEKTYLGVSITFEMSTQPEVEPQGLEQYIIKRTTPAEATFTCPLIFKRISRKKFIKLVMAQGCDRNYANEIADIIAKRRISYGMARVLLGL